VWDFGELPKKVSVAAGDGEVEAYPTLIDLGDAVRVCALTDRGEAKRQLVAGVRRLAVIAVGDQARSLVEGHPSADRLALRFATLGDPKRHMRELVELVVSRAVLGDSAPPRTGDDFERALNDGWNRLADEVDRVIGVVDQVATFHQAIELALETGAPAAWQRAVDDIDAQVGDLLAPGFLLSTPYRWLGQVPRYLKAIAVRLEKLRNGGAAAVDRDAQRIREVEPFDRAYRERRRDHDLRGIADPELEELRWMIQEYRVSVFAQELGAAVKVSPQRLARQWEKTRG